ncbi:MAG: single-stranded-DNA-specific exonuclease RecJ [Wujia sp.]
MKREARWTVYGKKADFKAIGEQFNIDQVVARVIRNRDIEGADKIRKYLQGTLTDTYNPSSMADMDKGCDIMIDRLNQGKPVRIISDYDVDGVMSNYILYDGLKNAGVDVSYEIPDRMLDGYGINERIIKDAYDDDIDTIITCDNGIAAFSAIELAKRLGMTVIVTDHHDIPYDTLSDGSRSYNMVAADAVIDNKRQDCKYPFKGLCGAGVAYKFIRRLYERLGLVWEDEYRYIEMLAIATVCDVMELVDENRIYVKQGLRVLERTGNIGLRALLERNGLWGKKLQAFHLGFIIGPCINATGRLESAKRGLELLLETDKAKAEKIAEELYELNCTRKDMTNRGVEKALAMAEADYKEDEVLVLYMPELHESLAGIVAGRVREAYYRPVLIVTDSTDDVVKGSGRSIEGYHMYDALNRCKDIFIKFGGHELAAGFSLKRDRLDELRRRLNEEHGMTEEVLTPVVRLDVPMPVSYISEKLIEDLNLLEPFGKGNEKPLFGQTGLRVKRASYVGRDQRFIRITFLDQQGYAIEGMDFNANNFIDSIKIWFGDEECDRMIKGLSNSIVLDVAYYPDINVYGNRHTLQIKPVMYRKNTNE